MKFKIFHKSRNRYLSDDELEGQYYYNGVIHKDSGGEWEDVSPFQVNLLTGKIQTNHDNACTDPDCCTPWEMFVDDNDFILSVISDSSDVVRYFKSTGEG